MKTGDTFLAAWTAIRMDTAGGQLFGHGADVGLPDYVAGQIHLVQQLLLAGAVDRIHSIG